MRRALQRGAFDVRRRHPTATATTTLVSIAVTPTQSTLAIAGTVQLKAVGTFSDNTTFDLTQSATWSAIDVLERLLPDAALTPARYFAVVQQPTEKVAEALRMVHAAVTPAK